MQSNLYKIRKASKGAVTATEAASTNTTTVPPGLFDIEVSVPIAATGTTPACTLAVNESTDGATYNALNDPRTISLPTTASTFFLRSVRITKWANGLPNLGVSLTVSGTTPSFGNVDIQLHPINVTRAWNGQP